MRTVRSWSLALVLFALALSSLPAFGEATYSGDALVQVAFDRLIPSSYPVSVTHFDSLQPTSYPVIHPGVARVHITENLVHPMEQPLLLTN